MPSGNLQGIYLKLDRAREHLDALDGEIKTFLDDHPITPVGSFDPATDCWVFRVGEVEPLPRRWGVIAGDIAHNVRSSLDHLVAQLVIANGRTPRRQHAFPVYTSRKTWEDVRRRKDKSPLHGLHPDAVSLIEQMQPFNSTAPDPDRSTLAGIHAIWNVDKHRLVHAVHSYTTDQEPTIILDPGPPMTGVEWAEYAPRTELVSGAEVARASLLLSPLANVRQVGITLVLNVTVGFDEGPGKPLAPVSFLAHAISEIRKAVGRFEPLM
ncbi:MAG TPA: hypothetical protein VHB02_04885 [Acidimicrobiales bacterium]|nr:hypothetical protein [Acidimicrobiales bacterium]